VIEQRVSVPVQDGTTLPGILAGPRSGPARGTVLLAHGIFTNKSEFGRFDRQARTLAEDGLRSLRFDFRGHGEHLMPSLEMSIGGMVLDFLTCLEYLRAVYGGPLYCVAASFGASVALLHQQTAYPIKPERMVLLNPVVEYGSTFVRPLGPTMREAFTEDKWSSLEQLGYIEPLAGVKLSRQFATELMLLRPYEAFAGLSVPTRIVHGTADRRVSCEVTRSYARASSAVDFVEIEGADHAFIPPAQERAAFALTREWLAAGVALAVHA